jgi:hypothetical protein
MFTIYLLKNLDLSYRNLDIFNSKEYFNKPYDSTKTFITETNEGYNDDVYEIRLNGNKLKEVKIYNFINVKRISVNNNKDLEKLEIINCNSLEILDVSNCTKLKQIDGLENHNIKLLECEGDTNINFLEEKFDINVMISKANEEINHIIDNIYLGDCSHTQDELLKLGISYVFNMTPNHYREYDKLIEVKIPLEDSFKQNITDIFPTAIEQVKELNDEGLKIYIHCYAGISRSASFVIYYLMKYHKMNFENSFKYVRDKRYCIQPNASFVEQLKYLEKNKL